MSGPTSGEEQAFEVSYSPKAIPCVRYGSQSLDLIFTHGAGGTLASDAIANFASGFGSASSILCFEGGMNLKSRVKMFEAVMKDQNYVTCLGGRSMGARAAVMAATNETSYLILVSYPLHTDKEVRDQILLDIRPGTKVLFISGDNDSMCTLSKLREIRKKMKCRTWMVVVKDGDHGMNVKPKKRTRAVGILSGRVAGEWLKKQDDEHIECKIWWDENDEAAQQSDWTISSEPAEPGVRLGKRSEQKAIVGASERRKRSATSATTEIVATHSASQKRKIK